MTKRRKQRVFNLAGYIAIFAVVITIAVVTWVRGMSLQKQLDAYDVRQEQLDSLIEQEENRTIQIEERKKYMQTKQYIEDVAREKVGLVYPDEIMFKSNK
ncbi:MAG: septum formation initiator family protein [Alistipes sp.]|nr:septum formation initiator family protein [Alistipes sp.]